jgi:class 3 adenylate cyclase/pimeloyl-ACP methyl ester carboxylesterase
MQPTRKLTVVQRPVTRFARSGSFNIAYQTIGDGPFDLVFIPAFASNVEVLWDEPGAADFLRRLADFARVIVFDKRGTGASDPVTADQLPTLEERLDDLRAVLRAVGSREAALFGWSESGQLACLFAAAHPEQVRALILFATYARAVRSKDYAEGWLPEDGVQEWLDTIEERWREGSYSPLVVGLDVAEAAQFERFETRYLRLSASPATAAAMARMAVDLDVRQVLPTIHVPTLAMCRVNDENAPATRAMAREIQGARFVELPPGAHAPFLGEYTALVEEIEHFLTGVRGASEPERILATLLFTDIVGSTERAAALGDRRWNTLLDRHHAIVREHLQRFRGEEVDTTGDGFLARFDGPARAVRCAVALTEALAGLGIDIRAGVHTGECELVGGKVVGIAVHVGARVASAADRGEVLVSRTVVDLVAGSRIAFKDRGEHRLKGISGTWRLFAAAPAHDTSDRSVSG